MAGIPHPNSASSVTFDSTISGGHDVSLGSLVLGISSVHGADSRSSVTLSSSILSHSGKGFPSILGLSDSPSSDEHKHSSISGSRIGQISELAHSVYKNSSLFLKPFLDPRHKADPLGDAANQGNGAQVLGNDPNTKVNAPSTILVADEGTVYSTIDCTRCEQGQEDTSGTATKVFGAMEGADKIHNSILDMINGVSALSHASSKVGPELQKPHSQTALQKAGSNEGTPGSQPGSLRGSDALSSTHSILPYSSDSGSGKTSPTLVLAVLASVLFPFF